MAYDEALAERVRAVLDDQPGLVEKKMFGGLAFMLNGNMACGILGDDLMVRVGPDAYEDALALPGAREMDFSGRPMRGFVVVAGESLPEDDDVAGWVGRGTRFAGSLPPK